MANILTYIDLVGSEASASSLEALNVGRQVASQLGATLYAVLPCKSAPSYHDEDVIAVLSRHGADKVILLSHPRFDAPGLYATHGQALLAACKRFPPKLLLFAASVAARDLAPRVAVALRAHFAADVSLESDGTSFTITRKIFRRRYVSREPLRAADGPVVLTLASQGRLELLGDDEAEVVVVHAPGDELPLVEVVEVFDGPGPRVSALATADLVVAGGAGLGRPENFELVHEIAQLLDGAAAASAKACGFGWAPPELQVGVDGAAVEAEHYLAIGISGSEEHLAALAPQTTIIAINDDPSAPIYEHARYGLLADAESALGELVDELAADRRRGIE